MADAAPRARSSSSSPLEMHSAEPSQRLIDDVLSLLDAASRDLDREEGEARDLVGRAVDLLRAEQRRASSASEPTVRGGLARWQVTRIIDHVEDHLSDPLRIRDVSRLLRLSPAYFSRAFRITYGQRPHAYIMGRRLARARQMILTTDTALSGIAAACGFSDQAHLSRTFRSAYRLSPAEWRREQWGAHSRPKAGHAQGGGDLA